MLNCFLFLYSQAKHSKAFHFINLRILFRCVGNTNWVCMCLCNIVTGVAHTQAQLLIENWWFEIVIKRPFLLFDSICYHMH